MRRLLVLSIVALTACEEAAVRDQRQKEVTTVDHLARGRAELLAGHPEKAISELKKASSLNPQDQSIYLSLAEAWEAAGNLTAASLALDQAQKLSDAPDPAIRRQRAELNFRMHQPEAAVRELIALRDDQMLTDREVIELARHLAHMGRIEDSFHTLELIQKRNPDDPDAKTMEAEILSIRGDDVTATRILDRLITDNPALASARFLRARYFSNQGEPEKALADLEMIDPNEARKPEVLALRATTLSELGRTDEAAGLLEQRVAADPKDIDALSLLAEMRLLQGRATDAARLVDQVLTIDSRLPRPLYVRGLSLEQQNQLEEALRDYNAALDSDGAFAPALKRRWRVQDRLGDKQGALGTLERLFMQNDIDAEEKVQLARYYADTWANVERGEKLINEALKKDPKNPEYLKIRSRLVKGNAGKPPKKQGGLQIIRGTRR